MTRVNSARSLKEYLDICAGSSNEHGVIAFPDSPHDAAGLRYYTNKEIHNHALAAVQHYLDQGLSIASSRTCVVGISAPGTLEWLATFIAFTRLGYSVLALSRSLSEETFDKLLERADCQILITDKPQQNSGVASVARTYPLISNGAINQSLRSPSLLAELATVPPPDNAFIWHSSGSTGVPKLLAMSQENALARITSYVASPYGKTTIWICSALYQSAGLTFMLGTLAKPCWSAWYNDRIPLSGKGLVEFLGECRPQATIFTPWALEITVKEPGGINLLKQIPSVGLFGAVCPQELGDLVIRQGVNLSTGYAMSETSTLMTSASRMRADPSDKDWDYMSPIEGPDKHMWFKPLSMSSTGDAKDELHELVILKGLANCPATLSNSDDPPGSFYTGDVFFKHPRKANCWKIIGRKDDQLNMGIPVVVNANEYETVLRNSTVNQGVEEVVLFGQGRKKLGILVFLREGGSSERATEAVRKVLDEKINPRMKIGVERDMVVCTEGQVLRTDKQNVMRAAVYKKFANIIDGAYQEKSHANSSL